MPGLTDEKSALIAMNQAMQKVTEEMGRMAISTGHAGKMMEQDFTRQFADWHWALNAMLDTLPFATGKGRGGNVGGPYFADIEANVLRGSSRSTDQQAAPAIDEKKQEELGNASFTHSKFLRGVVRTLGLGMTMKSFYQKLFKSVIELTRGNTDFNKVVHQTSRRFAAIMKNPLRMPSVWDQHFRVVTHQKVQDLKNSGEWNALAGDPRYASSQRQVSDLPRNQYGTGKEGVPPSMRFRKWSGMGGMTDFFPLGSEFATSHLLGNFMKHGFGVDNEAKTLSDPNRVGLEDLAKLRAHLTGSRQMTNAEYRRIHKATLGARDENNTPLYDRIYRRQLFEAYKLADKKYSQSQEHTSKLRAEGKLDGQVAYEERERIKALREGTREQRLNSQSQRSFTERIKSFTAEGGFYQFGKAGLQHGGTALQAASPDSFATLTGSFKLLSAVIGSELVPYANAASLNIQQFAKWMEGLGRQEKAWLRLGSALTIATAGAFILAPQLEVVAKLLKNVFLGTDIGKNGIGGLAGLAMSHPAVALGTASVAASVGAALWMDRQVAASSRIDKEQDAKDRENERTQSLDQIKASPEYQRWKDISPELRRKWRSRDRLKIVNQMDALDFEANKLRGNGTDPFGITTPFTAGKLKDIAEKRGKLRQQLSEHESIDLALEGKYKQSPQAKQKHDNQILAVAPLLQSFQSHVQPAYYGIEDVYKRIQLSALAESPLDQEIRRIQLDQLEKMSQGNGFLEQIVGDLKTALTGG